MIEIDKDLTDYIFGIIGFLSSLIGIYQFIQNRELKRTLNKIKRTEEADLWTYIGSVVKTYEALTDARKLLCEKADVDFESLSKIQSARRGTIDLYLMLLKDASIKEDIFTDATIKRWIELGRLENDWRIAKAKRLLPTKSQEK